MIRGWKVEDEVHGRKHVWPVGDLIDHELIGQNCVCGPWLDLDEATGCWFVIHRPLDGREEPA